MTGAAHVQWAKALRSLATARSAYRDGDTDSAASRAYYAAFHAVTAHFALRGQLFKKHAHIRAALHRDLILTGVWFKEFGTDFDLLLRTRDIGDYNMAVYVDSDEALQAIEAAARIIDKVSESHPSIFTKD